MKQRVVKEEKQDSSFSDVLLKTPSTFILFVYLLSNIVFLVDMAALVPVLPRI